MYPNPRACHFRALTRGTKEEHHELTKRKQWVLERLPPSVYTEIILGFMWPAPLAQYGIFSFFHPFARCIACALHDNTYIPKMIARRMRRHRLSVPSSLRKNYL